MKTKQIIIGITASAVLSLVPVVSAASLDLDGVSDDLTDTLRERIEDYQETQRLLVEERRALAEELKEMTPAERRARIEQYQADHAEQLAEHRALGEEIRAATKELQDEGDNRPNRELTQNRPRAEPPQSEEVRARVDEFRQARQDHLAQRQLLRDTLDGEELREALRQLREDMIAQQRAWVREHRDTMRERREDRK